MIITLRNPINNKESKHEYEEALSLILKPSNEKKYNGEDNDINIDDDNDNNNDRDNNNPPQYHVCLIEENNKIIFYQPTLTLQPILIVNEDCKLSLEVPKGYHMVKKNKVWTTVSEVSGARNVFS